MKSKNIVIIETPISMKCFTQVTCLMDDDELTVARQERPDLVFRVASELPVSSREQPLPELPEPLPPLREDQGITIRGMTLPADLEHLMKKVLEDK